MYDVTVTITVTANDEGEAIDRIHEALRTALEHDTKLPWPTDNAIIRGWSDCTAEPAKD